MILTPSGVEAADDGIGLAHSQVSVDGGYGSVCVFVVFKSGTVDGQSLFDV